MKSFAERQFCSDLSVFPHDFIPRQAPLGSYFLMAPAPAAYRAWPLNPSPAAVPGQARSVHCPGAKHLAVPPTALRLQAEPAMAGGWLMGTVVQAGCQAGQTHGSSGPGLPSCLQRAHSEISPPPHPRFLHPQMEMSINLGFQGHWENSMTGGPHGRPLSLKP